MEQNRKAQTKSQTPPKFFVADVPLDPGVYLHKDKYGEIIYVGKASSLRKRLSQYFGSKANMDRKVSAMVDHIADFEYIVTKSEKEALLLENTLIKRYMPRFNVMLRDDKTYPYIKVTLNEDYPRVLKTRQIKDDGSRYFGPYSDVGSVNKILDLLNDIYMLKRCKEKNFKQGANVRMCLNGHIGRCSAVCQGTISVEQYKERIDKVIDFLNGRDKSLLRELETNMKEASAKMDYEQASLYRDKLFAARSVVEKQSVDLLGGGDMDIVLTKLKEPVVVEESGTAEVDVTFEAVATDVSAMPEVAVAIEESTTSAESVVPKESCTAEADVTSEAAVAADVSAMPEVAVATEESTTSAAFAIPNESTTSPELAVLQPDGDSDTQPAPISAIVSQTVQVTVFFVRDGKLSGREIHLLDASDYTSDSEVITAFIMQYYANNMTIPKKIVLEHSIDDEQLIEETLSGIRESQVSILVPQRGRVKALLDLAISDRDESFRKMEEKTAAKDQKAQAAYRALYSIASEAAMPKSDVTKDVVKSDALTGVTKSVVKSDVLTGVTKSVVKGNAKNDAQRNTKNEANAQTAAIMTFAPPRLEAYDISNTGGVDSVAAMVVFEGERPKRQDYRRFKIRTIEDQDDYAAMQEVLYRRFKRMLDGADGFAHKPWAVLIDGGLGHTHAAEEILSAMGPELADVHIIGMVKDDKHRSRGLVYKEKEYDIKLMPELYHLVGTIQEEVHRFAITYHRKVRSNAMIRSALDEIPGVGPKRRAALLATFGSVDEIKRQEAHVISEKIGISEELAQNIIEYLQKK
ncbi:MAG: excinuclease ABC subunit UvrC [Clostridiales Family XIII bacterium]|jgi:excinuclease UvrABC nuclease subunit|nr:excinuclease ABC subunit UvrC [Clostridiales Family XIII bacterium]